MAQGEPGELIIGVGLARYLDADKDAAVYAAMPALGWDRAYRSGDVVRFDGTGLVFQGRADDQVKVGGRRIELGEIDSALLALPGVSGAAAAVKPSDAGNRLLVGYVTATGDFDPRAAAEQARACRRRWCRGSPSSTRFPRGPPGRSTARRCRGCCR